MNAHELADIVDKWAYKESAEYLTDAATMLRQQADRIRNLEKTLGFKNSGYETINLTPPVAWINLDRFNDEALYLADCVSETKVDNMGITTPLYTHPVKELTDEEIWDVIDDCFGVHAFNLDYQIALDEAREDAFELVKAILRKALK